MTSSLRIHSLSAIMLSAFLIVFACKSERELLQDKLELLVQVSEHTEPNLLFLNYMGAPKEDLDAEEGLLVVPMEMIKNNSAVTNAGEGTEFVLVVSRKISDQNNGPALRVFDPATGEYSETAYHIIGVSPKKMLDE